MVYPTIGDYELSVYNLKNFVLAPQFKGGIPVLNKSGVFPQGLSGSSGGQSVVYPILVNTKKLALRCWIKDPGNVKERYTKVRAYLLSDPSSYFVDFGYVDEGIFVNGSIYPISYMEWIEGKTLARFLDDNINNRIVVQELANKFLIMVTHLHRKHISHGDLQDGNIIVYKSGNSMDLKLVDYDCVFVPTLQNWSNPNDLQGIADYQHPKRSNQNSEKSDYFSELIIYLSLLVYSERPDLWNKGQEKKLLFSANDFKPPYSSPIFLTLEDLSPDIQHLTSELKRFCSVSDTDKLLPLEQLISSSPKPSTFSNVDFIEDFFKPVTTATIPKEKELAGKVASRELEEFFLRNQPTTVTDIPNISPAPLPPVAHSPAPPPPVTQSPKLSIWKPIFPLIGILLIILATAIYFSTAKTASVTIYATLNWQATGVTLNKNSVMYINYISGNWTVDGSEYEPVGPEGYTEQISALIWNPSKCKLLQNASFGTLLGKINNGPVFEVGRSKLLMASNEGELFLSINDSYNCVGDNQGEIVVGIIAK